jgi:hypothetical protein
MAGISVEGSVGTGIVMIESTPFSLILEVDERHAKDKIKIMITKNGYNIFCFTLGSVNEVFALIKNFLGLLIFTLFYLPFVTKTSKK